MKGKFVKKNVIRNFLLLVYIKTTLRCYSFNREGGLFVGLELSHLLEAFQLMYSLEHLDHKIKKHHYLNPVSQI